MKKPLQDKPHIISAVALEILVGISLAGLAFILFFDLSHRILTEEFLSFDHAIMTALYAVRTPQMTQLMFFITELGGTFVLLTVSSLAVVLLLWKKYRYEAALFGLTFAFGFLLNLVFKSIIARTRPDVAPLIQEIFYSYPSGHSMNSFVLYALIAYLFYHFTRKKWLSLLVSLLSAGIILLIGMSRIYLGVHYPSDVIAGYLAGLGWFLTVLVIDRTVRIHRKNNL